MLLRSLKNQKVLKQQLGRAHEALTKQYESTVSGLQQAMLNGHRDASAEVEMWRARREKVADALGRWEREMEKSK